MSQSRSRHDCALTLVVLLVCLFTFTSTAVSATTLSAYLTTTCGGSCTGAQLATFLTTTTVNSVRGDVITVSGHGLTEIDYPGLNLFASFSPIGFDFSKNSLTQMPQLNTTSCTWCSSNLVYVDLSHNNLNNAVWDSTFGSPLLGSGGPGLSSQASSFLGTFSTQLFYFDLSHNPITTLPPYFGSTDGNWFHTGFDITKMPTLKCANCSLTGLPYSNLGDHSFGANFLTLDLSLNSFTVDANMNWVNSIGSSSFGVINLLNLSASGLTNIPSGLDFANGYTSPYSAILDFSQNSLTTSGTFNFASLTFAGTLNLSHCGMTVLTPAHFVGSSIGNIDLSYNSFGANFDIGTINLQISGVALSGATGILRIRHAGLTSLPANAFYSTGGSNLYDLDLSGNSFPSSSSWGTSSVSAFNGLSTTYLHLRRANLTGDTLLATSGSPFQNAMSIGNLVMDNSFDLTSDWYDNTIVSQAGWNTFDPLPSSWLISSSAPFASSQTILTIGEVVNTQAGFFGSWAPPTSVSITLRLPSDSAPLALNGPIYNLFTGYSAVPLNSRIIYQLTLTGANFAATTNLLAPGSIVDTTNDRLLPLVLSMPLDPAFLISNFYGWFSGLTYVSYTNPSTYTSTTATTPWSGLLTAATIPSDLLCSASSLTDFHIDLASDTAPSSPLTSLPASFFQCVVPFTGFGSLTTIDIGSAQMTSYPAGLFSGLSRPNTALHLDMNMLYSSPSPLPIGLWDDIVGTVDIGSTAPALGSTATINKLKKCGYLVSNVCQVCPSGSYLNSNNGYYFCSRCTAGRLCVNGVSSPCPIGTYNPSMDQSTCTKCPQGTYNTELGQTHVYACLNCPSGYYQPFLGNGSASTIACQQCPLGQTSLLPGSASCTSCPAGTYTDSARTSCLNCASGRYSGSSGTIYPYVGSQAGATAANSCVDCANGWFSALAGLSTCTMCKAGTYMDPARTSCNDCDAGLYSPAGTTYSAVGVQAGATASNSCVNCTDGWYSAVTGSSTCTVCAAGTYQLPSRTGCGACGAGRYSAVSGTVYPSVGFQAGATIGNSCRSCADGMISSNTGQTVCNNCTAGTFMNTARTVCLQCDAGRYSPPGTAYPYAGSDAFATIDNSCRNCSDGWYSAVSGSSMCTICPIGTYQLPSRTGCAACAPGRFSNVPGTVYPSVGFVSGATTSNSCEDCADGMYSFVAGSTSCSICPSGTFMAANRTTCIPCDAGRFSTAGTTYPFVGATGAATTANSCLDCSDGQFSAVPGSLGCTNCTAGTYQLPSRSGCSACAPGRYSGPGTTYPYVGSQVEATSANSCSDCPDGYFSSISGVSSCTACAAGQYMDSQRTGCLDCDAGRYSIAGTAYAYPGSDPGATLFNSCRRCRAGYYSSASGATACTVCDKGTYMDPSRTQCNPCDVGSYGHTSGLFYETLDDAVLSMDGVSAPPPNSTNSCLLCPNGTYAGFTGLTACLSCPAGTYMDPSRSVCQSCNAGRFSPAGTTYPYVGVTPDAVRNNSCRDCADGYVSAKDGASACVQCGLGTYMDPTRTVCSQCAAGRYTEINGTVYDSVNVVPAATVNNSCVDCPFGQTIPAGGKNASLCAAVQCASGKYYDALAALNALNAHVTTLDPISPFCFACPPGYECSSNKKTLCAAGTYSYSTATVCTPCASGKYNFLTGQTSIDSCLPCPEGTWQNISSAVSCTSCPFGTINPKVGSVVISDCLSCEERIALENITAYSVCPQGATVVIPLDTLLPASVNFTSSNATSLSNRNAYLPVRDGRSLRLAVSSEDDTLTLAGATSDTNTGGYDPTGPLVVSDTVFAVMLALVITAGVQLFFYRFYPEWAVKMDMMPTAHFLKPGGIMVKRPTKWGFSWSVAFILVATYVATQLGTSSNATITSTLQPGSANTNTGQALAAWEITMKAYGAPPQGSGATLSLDAWCYPNSAALISSVNGFIGASNISAYPTSDGACAITFDCLNCHISGDSKVAFTMPYVAQLVEWEIFTTGAVPDSWHRFYGVLTQLNDQMLDSIGSLHFSAIESYFVDKRSTSSITYCSDANSNTKVTRHGVTCSLATPQSGSGYELAFNSYSSDQTQAYDAMTADSTVTINFVFAKQDVVYQTIVQAKLSGFQIFSSVLATVVSLLSVFMFLFRQSERVLHKFHLTAGPMPVAVHVLNETEEAVEEERQRRAKNKVVSMDATNGKAEGGIELGEFAAVSPAAGSGPSNGDAVRISMPPSANTPASPSATSPHKQHRSTVSMDVSQIIQESNNRRAPPGGVGRPSLIDLPKPGHPVANTSVDLPPMSPTPVLDEFNPRNDSMDIIPESAPITANPDASSIPSSEEPVDPLDSDSPNVPASSPAPMNSTDATHSRGSSSVDSITSPKRQVKKVMPPGRRAS